MGQILPSASIETPAPPPSAERQKAIDFLTLSWNVRDIADQLAKSKFIDRFNWTGGMRHSGEMATIEQRYEMSRVNVKEFLDRVHQVYSDLKAIKPTVITLDTRAALIALMHELMGWNAVDTDEQGRVLHPDAELRTLRRTFRDAAELIRGPLLLAVGKMIASGNEILDAIEGTGNHIFERNELVSMRDVAALVFLEPRTLERYRKDWPEPDVPGKGNQPDRWLYLRLRPKLAEQFPDLTLPATPPKQSVAEHRNGNGKSLHT